MQELGNMAAAAASKAIIPLTFAIIAVAEDKWAAYSEQDTTDLKALIDLYKKNCAGKNQLARYSFDPSFDAHLNEEKRPGFDPQLPIYFQFDNNKSRPFLYDEIQGKHYAPCKESQRWFEQIRPGHLSSGIAEAIGYVCEAQRIRDNDFLKRKYSYDPINLFCEELKAWLLQLSSIPLDSEEVISKIKARIKYLEAVRTRASLFKEQGILVKVKMVNKYSNTIRVLAKHVKEIIEGRLLPLAKEIYEHRCAREHFEKLCLTIEFSIKEQVCFLFYMLQDAKVSPNFLLQELAYPRISSYEDLPNSAFNLLLKHLVCSNAFLMVFPHPQVQPKLQASSEKPSLAQTFQVLPHDSGITPKFVNDFKDKQGLLVFPELGIPGLDRFQLSKCDPAVADKENIDLGVLPIFKNAADMKTVLGMCAHIQMLCFCHVLSKEFFELAGDGGDLVTYRLAAKRLDPILEKFQHIIKEGLALIDKIKQRADKSYDTYFSPQKEKAGKRSKGMLAWLSSTLSSPSSETRPEWASAWAEQNYRIASDTYEQYVEHQEAIQNDLKEMRKKIKEINSPAYDEYLANKLSKLDRLMQSFCQFYPDLQSSSRLVFPFPAPALEPAVEQKIEAPALTPQFRSNQAATSHFDPALELSELTQERDELVQLIKLVPSSPHAQLDKRLVVIEKRIAVLQLEIQNQAGEINSPRASNASMSPTAASTLSDEAEDNKIDDGKEPPQRSRSRQGRVIGANSESSPASPLPASSPRPIPSPLPNNETKEDDGRKPSHSASPFSPPSPLSYGAFFSPQDGQRPTPLDANAKVGGNIGEPSSSPALERALELLKVGDLGSCKEAVNIAERLVKSSRGENMDALFLLASARYNLGELQGDTSELRVAEEIVKQLQSKFEQSDQILPDGLCELADDIASKLVELETVLELSRFEAEEQASAVL